MSKLDAHQLKLDLDKADWTKLGAAIAEEINRLADLGDTPYTRRIIEEHNKRKENNQ